MLKIVFFLVLVFVVSCVWASRLSCGSCGPECAPACGTRRFRACCFNYLRRKRTEDVQVHLLGDDLKQVPPFYHFEKTPSEEQWIYSILANENLPYNFENRAENHQTEV